MEICILFQNYMKNIERIEKKNFFNLKIKKFLGYNYFVEINNLYLNMAK